MNYVIDGRSGVLKSWGTLNADIRLTAVTLFEVKDQRKLSTYAGAWGGFDVMTGIGPTERVLTVKGRVSNDLSSRDATARVRAVLDKLMESQEPVAYISPVASIPRGILTGVTVTQAGVSAVDVELTIRAVRTVDAESVAGEKAPLRAKKGGKDTGGPTASKSSLAGSNTKTASKPAADEPKDNRSLLAKFADSASSTLDGISKWKPF
jgi:hypothetical protein|nr:MAG TPA: hypothetical protein [Caudoviricetes sp.]